ncbi:MAG: hypothetical protein HZB76_03670 [Chlamydiae bacterium]|nr:hypothetical protein [Chlamydiota bacterium]
MLNSQNNILLDADIYNLEIIKRAIYKHQENASFLISNEHQGKLKLSIIPKNENFNLSQFFDDLNYYNFIETENKRAIPIMDALIEGIKKNIENKLNSYRCEKRIRF